MTKLRQRPRGTRRMMARDYVISPWGEEGIVDRIEGDTAFVKWGVTSNPHKAHRKHEPQPIERSLVQLRPVGRPKKP